MNNHKTSTIPENLSSSKITTRDGIVDIMLGMFIVLISITFSVDTNPSPIVLAVIIPLLTRKLKFKYIYPRLDKTLVKAEMQNKLVKRQWIIALILSAGVLGMILTVSIQNSDHISSPLFNVVGILISGTILIGGISAMSIFYIYALVLAIPMIVLQYTHGVWLGLTLLTAVMFLLILGIIWLGFRRATNLPWEKGEDYEKVAHGFLSEVGWIFFAYFLFATYMPEFAVWIRSQVGSYAQVFFGNMFALIIVTLAIVYKTPRYYLYALMVSLSLILYGKMLSFCVFPQFVPMVPGLLILIWGIIILMSFIKNNPILPEQED